MNQTTTTTPADRERLRAMIERHKECDPEVGWKQHYTFSEQDDCCWIHGAPDGINLPALLADSEALHQLEELLEAVPVWPDGERVSQQTFDILRQQLITEQHAHDALLADSERLARIAEIAATAAPKIWIPERCPCAMCRIQEVLRER